MHIPRLSSSSGCKCAEKIPKFTKIYPVLHIFFSLIFFYLEIYRFYLKIRRHIWSRKTKNKIPQKKTPPRGDISPPLSKSLPPSPHPNPSKFPSLLILEPPFFFIIFLYFHFITFLSSFLGCFEVSFFTFSPEPSKVVAYITGRVLQNRAYPPIFPLPDFPYSLSYLSPVESGLFLFVVFSVDCLSLMSP